MNKWISVKDRLPDSCGGYLIFDYGCMTAWFDYESGEWDGEEGKQGPTHWMLLPAPPEVEK